MHDGLGLCIQLALEGHFGLSLSLSLGLNLGIFLFMVQGSSYLSSHYVSYQSTLGRSQFHRALFPTQCLKRQFV